MEDRSATSLEDVGGSSTYYAPNNAVLTVAGDSTATPRWLVERHFGPIPANDNLPRRRTVIRR
jgi:predicted Zn-dependent peptidase